MNETRFIRIAGAAALASVLGCALAWPAAAQSLTDRFKGLFGGKKEEPPPLVSAQPAPEVNCPQVTIRAGASTYAVAAPGKPSEIATIGYQTLP